MEDSAGSAGGCAVGQGAELVDDAWPPAHGAGSAAEGPGMGDEPWASGRGAGSVDAGGALVGGVSGFGAACQPVFGCSGTACWCGC